MAKKQAPATTGYPATIYVAIKPADYGDRGIMFEADTEINEIVGVGDSLIIGEYRFVRTLKAVNLTTITPEE